MATALTTPQIINQPVANAGDRSTLPETTAIAGQASIAEGIPPECSLPVASGGSYVKRTDVNGIAYLSTSLQYFMQNGGAYSFDAAVASAIGGYPTGARLITTIGGRTVRVRSLVNNNSLDPATNLDGVNWTLDCFDQLLTYASFRDEKTTGTDGGSLVGSSWNTRDLAEVENNINGCSITSNQITLPVGTYRIKASAPAAKFSAESILYHKTALYNDSDSAFEIIGTSEVIDTSATSGGQTRSFLNGVITISAEKTFELQHYGSTSQTTVGLGAAVGGGVSEIYSELEIWKLI